MDFDAAILAHSSWKMKLSGYLRKPDGSLNAGEVRADNRCALGQWLHNDGRRHSSMPEYRCLVAEHARFHRCAAHIVECANMGEQTQEATALGSNSEYADASTKVVSAIMAMKRKIAAAA